MRPDLYTHTLNQLRFGGAQNELSEELTALIDQCRQSGRMGELTLTIKIKPVGNTGQYELEDIIKTKAPKMDKGKTLMFGTPEGNLTRENPDQKDLQLQSVSDDKPISFKKAN